MDTLSDKNFNDLSKQFQDDKKPEEDKPQIFPLVEPWPSSVDLSGLLSELFDTIKSHVVFTTDHDCYAVTLWVVYTYFLDSFQISPILNISSPEKRCGKSTLLDILQQTVYKPLSASSITSAAIFRSVERWCPTLIVDEADTFIKTNEELRGIINSGHRKSSAFVIRCEGKTHEPKKFSTWCPKVIAGIGGLPGTVKDRSLLVKLKRKRNKDKTASINNAARARSHELARKCLRFRQDNLECFAERGEIKVDTLNDRQLDNWQPLFTIANYASEHWLTIAKKAAINISESTDEDDSESILLLHDIKKTFNQAGKSQISTSELIEALCEIQDSPWATYNNPRDPITSRQLSQQLKAYEINARQLRIDGRQCRGYKQSNFEDAFQRYLPPFNTQITVTPVTSVTNVEKQQPENSEKKGRVTDATDVTPNMKTRN